MIDFFFWVFFVSMLWIIDALNNGAIDVFNNGPIGSDTPVFLMLWACLSSSFHDRSSRINVLLLIAFNATTLLIDALDGVGSFQHSCFSGVMFFFAWSGISHSCFLLFLCRD
jgi:hypothetical protein